MLKALRILDANFNRCSEGLRVIEDYLRLALNDAHLTELCKGLRHELAAIRQPLHARLLAARDTQHDVGTRLSSQSEQQRSDLRHVAVASQMRAEQALRSLEECAKAVAPEAAAPLEALRYRLYTLGQAWQISEQARERLGQVKLYVLLDGGRSVDSLQALARQALEGGADALQLRDKQLCDRELLARARLLRQVTRDSGCLLMINDRPDLAKLCEADGVHVGQDELGVQEAREVAGADALVGVSTHSLQQARQAVLDGADYIGCGPTFPSGTKEFTDFPGLALLREVAAEITLPAFAIGGITADNAPQVLQTGIHRLAVSGAVTRAKNAGAAAQRLQEMLG